MTNARSICVDPSALRRLYVHDSRSANFCRWRGRVGDGLPITLHGQAELVSSISLATFRGALSREAAAQARVALDGDIAAGRLERVDLLWRQALLTAADLSRAHTPQLGTRTLDVLHVASALALGARRFVTYDTRQAALARVVKLRVLAP